MKTYKIVKVDWTDSINCRGWRDSKKVEELEPASCVSSGILVKTKHGSIGVANSMGDGEIGDTMVISRKAIKKVEVLGKFRA